MNIGTNKPSINKSIKIGHTEKLKGEMKK